ncbi:ABC transporter permease [Nesterenkonia alkaliphila]|uniref:ABC transporter permease subunit n=1 Tax=Nesterenkonia alkaliphila TaxID=1463631 RepID=A0A7K1UJP8_9MICC|nr:ABC transporter permease [Nesterenkonia alkaliphila]MVT26709.1 ABC transporter permease subunit [Nesterenkonia alkaliphila]GFZ76896.1 glutathione ABC transporter permease [Nesterenkonia alkaliphila]
MARYLGRRLLQALATIFVVVTVTFIIGRLAGSPSALILGEWATPEQIAALDVELGFDRPYLVQYADYLGGLLQGDFGNSYRDRGTSSMAMVMDRLPDSLVLGAAGLSLGLLMAFAAVLFIHLTRWWPLRSVMLGLGSMRQSLPDFFFGLLLVLILSVSLGWLPSLGSGSLQTLIMPALTIATGQFIVYARLLDNALLEQGKHDYVRTALARGESPRRVVLAETLPNGLLPVMTVAGINLGTFLGGLVIVENVFAWPGMGQLMLTATFSRDFAVVQSGLIMVAVLFVAANLLVDFLYGIVDPRVRMR